MSVRNTVQIGESVLRETASEVFDFKDKYIREVASDLTDTMRANELIGMAAPQIGESIRIFVTEIRETAIRKDNFDELRIYCNPEILNVSHETDLDWEGCGSIPEILGKVERATEITLKYMDEKGVSREMSASGLLARVIQHEIDHLNGVLFTDLADAKTYVSKEYFVNNIIEK